MGVALPSAVALSTYLPGLDRLDGGFIPLSTLPHTYLQSEFNKS